MLASSACVPEIFEHPRDMIQSAKSRYCRTGVFTIYLENIIIEPAHDRAYNKTCVTSKDSDQPVHPPSKARVLDYSSLNSL